MEGKIPRKIDNFIDEGKLESIRSSSEYKRFVLAWLKSKLERILLPDFVKRKAELLRESSSDNPNYMSEEEITDEEYEILDEIDELKSIDAVREYCILKNIKISIEEAKEEA